MYIYLLNLLGICCGVWQPVWVTHYLNHRSSVNSPVWRWIILPCFLSGPPLSPTISHSPPRSVPLARVDVSVRWRVGLVKQRHDTNHRDSRPAVGLTKVHVMTTVGLTWRCWDRDWWQWRGNWTTTISSFMSRYGFCYTVWCNSFYLSWTSFKNHPCSCTCLRLWCGLRQCCYVTIIVSSTVIVTYGLSLRCVECISVLWTVWMQHVDGVTVSCVMCVCVMCGFCLSFGRVMEM